MLSWVCQELEYPRKFLTKAEFGNRTTSAWSGRAWCWSNEGQILVRVGGDDRFPTEAKTHIGGFTIGLIADRLEALVKVTAHEVAHCEQTKRGSKSRRSYATHRNTAGSERNTDMHAGRVLTAFRERRTELVAGWSAAPTRKAKSKPSPVEQRANAAFNLEKKWESKLKRAKNALAKAQKKAAYYRKNYPDGVYPESCKATVASHA